MQHPSEAAYLHRPYLPARQACIGAGILLQSLLGVYLAPKSAPVATLPCAAWPDALETVA